jgi:hypothetical protein
MNLVVPLVFGQQFRLSREAVAFLAVGCFFRIARSDPFTSMLIHTGRTRRLALANLSSSSALMFELGLILAFGTIESVLVGRLLGELAALAVIVIAMRHDFREILRDWIETTAFVLAVLVGAIVLTFMTSVGERWGPSLLTLAVCIALCALCAARSAFPLVRTAFPGRNLSTGRSVAENPTAPGSAYDSGAPQP